MVAGAVSSAGNVVERDSKKEQRFSRSVGYGSLFQRPSLTAMHRIQQLYYDKYCLTASRCSREYLFVVGNIGVRVFKYSPTGSLRRKGVAKILPPQSQCVLNSLLKVSKTNRCQCGCQAYLLVR